MPIHNNLTAEYVRSVLDYAPHTGLFIWKHRPLDHFVHESAQKTWNTRFFGKEAGSDHEGYVVIVIGGVLYRAHRLAWLIMTNEWPQFEVDHKDLKRSNNSWDNLRAATSAQNSHNIPKRKNNKSGYKGVDFHSQNKKWRARIMINGIQVLLGLFDKPELAHEAYRSASLQYHGDFGRAA